MRFLILKRSTSALLIAFLAPAGLLAQLPAARLAHLFPPGARAGSQLEVVAAGSDLEDPARIHFSHAGISGTNAAGKFNVSVASNVPPGIYEARFAGRFGLSNPRAFAVGTLPEAVCLPTNTSIATALRDIPESTVNGRILPNSAGWFTFTAKKGARLLLECVAEGIDSRMEPTLILSDSHGRELELSRTTGLIDFTPGADGEYRLRVADRLYRGGDDFIYRLTLSTGPHLDFVLPAAGVSGTKSNFTLYGRNLPGGQPVKGQLMDGKPLEQLVVSIDVPSGDRATRLDTALPAAPAAGGIDCFSYRLNTPLGVSNPLLIGIATAPAVIAEREPNNRPAQAQKITPPCEVSGQFFPAGDVDLFDFDAKKGDLFWIEVFSQQLGLPTDPTLVVQRLTKKDKGIEQAEDVAEVYDNDANIGDREFSTASRDPVTRFEAKENGAYRIMVRDGFGETQASPRHVYRLAVRRETPDFRIVAMAVAPKFKADAKDIPIGVPLLRRGESISVRVMAFRRDGFNGDIHLSFEDLPPGLIFEGDRIEAGKSTDYILLTATENAAAFAGPVHLVGRAMVGGKELVREARGGTMRFPVASTDTDRPKARVTSDFTLAICDEETAPILVTPDKRLWEAAEKSKLDIPLRIVRHGEFNAAFKLKPLGPGTPESLKEFDVDAKATNVVLKLDLAALKLAPGTYVFSAQGITTGKYRNNPEGAAAAGSAAKTADKLASEAIGGEKKAGEEFDKASKASSEAEAAVTSAAAKLAAAKTAAEKLADDEKTQAAVGVAQAQLDETAAKAILASETKSAAGKLKLAAAMKSKEAQTQKEETAKRAKELTDKAKPRDVSYQVTAAPFTVKVTSAPVAKAADPKQAKSK